MSEKPRRGKISYGKAAQILLYLVIFFSEAPGFKDGFAHRAEALQEGLAQANAFAIIQAYGERYDQCAYYSNSYFVCDPQACARDNSGLACSANNALYWPFKALLGFPNATWAVFTRTIEKGPPAVVAAALTVIFGLLVFSFKPIGRFWEWLGTLVERWTEKNPWPMGAVAPLVPLAYFFSLLTAGAAVAWVFLDVFTNGVLKFVILVGAPVVEFAGRGHALFEIAETVKSAFAPEGHAVTASAQAVTAVAAGISAAQASGLVEGLDRIRCAGCGADVPASSRFCHACGEPVAKRETCPQCGAACAGDLRFCVHCGKRRER
jgi:hypothetical protein